VHRNNYNPNSRQPKNLILWGCTGITTIPTLPNLTSLYCSGCTGLTTISPLPDLITLDCTGCTGITTISPLPDLITLDCTGCTGITCIPPVLNLTYLYCGGCTWIDPRIEKSNLKKLITLQRFVKKNYRYFTFKHWIKSRAGVEWLYSPDNIGGKVVKKQIEKLLEKRDDDKNDLLILSKESV
jgi:hypothetical protein